MVRKWAALLALGCLIFGGADARQFLHGSGAGSSAPSFTAQWAPLRLGAGGQITAVYNYPDNTTIARADAYGAWVYQPSGGAGCTYGWVTYAAPCWRSVITVTGFPGYGTDTNFAEGATEIQAAPSNTNVLYMLWGKAPVSLWVSQDRGVTWTKLSNFPGSAQTANNGNSSGPFMAVDPNDPNTVLIDTNGQGSNGVQRTTNGLSGATATFAAVPTVGTTQTHLIAFQPGSSTHIVIWTQGVGAFESTNGATYTAITAGSPPSASIGAPHLYADKFNQFWIADAKASTANIYRWASSTWSAIATGATGNGSAAALAIDPASASVGANHLAVTSYTGQLVISSNNGTSWTPQQTDETVACAAAQPTWLCNANQNQANGGYLLNTYSIVFDQSSNIFLGGGIGIWQTNAPIVSTATVWNANTLGVEEFITLQTISPPGGWPITGVWDRGFLLNPNPDVFAASNYNNSAAKEIIIDGWTIDYAVGSIGFLTGYISSTAGGAAKDFSPATSTDGGNTFTQWANSPTPSAGQPGGAIAASTNQNWILVPSVSSPIYFTTNGATTAWTQSTISGTPTNWSPQGEFSVGFPLAADRANTGNFCAVTGGQVFYQSINQGANFAATGVTGGGGANQVDGNAAAFTFRSHPTHGFTYYYTSGQQSGASHPANIHLWKITKTTNPCDTATSVNANVKEVMAFGWGAPPPTGGTGVPTMYINGWFNGVQGVFQSVDDGATWTAINVPASQQPWPLNNADFTYWLEGDPDVYGRIYNDFQGSGGSYIDTADACPWVKFNPSSVTPGASLTGTVSLTASHSGLVPVVAVDFYVDGTLIGRQTSGSGTPTTYTQSWVTGGVATGAHTLKVLAEGSTNPACTTSLTVGNSQSIPVTTH